MSTPAPGPVTGMVTAELDLVVTQFRTALHRARRAGYDREQIAAHLGIRPRTLSSLLWSWDRPDPTETPR